MIIAIDGPSGAGKSTLGKKLAREFGLLYLDTGAMYRAVALAAIEKGIALTDHEKLSELARNSQIKLEGAPEHLHVFLNDRDITKEIRTNEVGQAASIVSVVSDVRKILVQLQQQLGASAKNGCVLDGRDIGSVVFPNADVKFFLTARPDSRAQRRFEEDAARGIPTTYDKTLTEINDRDKRDVTRSDSPLTIAEGAIVLDTSEMDVDEVFEQMCEKIRANGISVR
jgi:cytidylate kinase